MSQTNSVTNFSEKNFGVLTDSPDFLERCTQLCQEFSYSLESWDNVESFLSSKPQSKFIIACITQGPKGPLPAAEVAQSVRFTTQDAFLICVISNSFGKMGKEEAVFAKKSGADLIILEDEAFNTGKLEFITTQILRSKFIPIKTTDLVAGRPIPFDLYHLMPQRRKFLKIVFNGDILEDSKIKKAVDVGEFYFDRENGDEFNRYTLENTDRSAAGIRKRCRSQFLALFSGFSKLVFQLTDQSQHSSYTEGQTLLTQCTNLCSSLLGTLAESGKAWDVINNSAIGDMGSVERAPSIAAYAGVFGLQLGLKSTDQMMLAALLSDLGLLFLTPEILKKIRENRNSEFSADELTLYETYPHKTLDVCLNRKLSIPEKLRQLLLSTQQRADGKGFPKGSAADRITVESQLISFSREFDRETLLQMGKARVEPQAVFKEMIQREKNPTGRYSPLFIQQLRKACK